MEASDRRVGSATPMRKAGRREGCVLFKEEIRARERERERERERQECEGRVLATKETETESKTGEERTEEEKG